MIEEDVEVCAPDDPLPSELAEDDVEVDAWAPDDPVPAAPELTEDEVPVEACAPDDPAPVPLELADDDVPVDAWGPASWRLNRPCWPTTRSMSVAPEAPVPVPLAFTEDDVEVVAAAPPGLALVVDDGAEEPVLVLACPFEPVEEVARGRSGR